MATATSTPELWRQSAFDPGGFYRDAELIVGQHFRTSAHVGGPFVEAIVQLLVATDGKLGRPARITFADVGAGDGNLIAGVVATVGARHPNLALRLDGIAVDLRPRPAAVPETVRWIVGSASDVLPTIDAGMIVCSELLDDQPVETARRGDESRLDLAVHICQRLLTGSVLFIDYHGDQHELASYRKGQCVPVTFSTDVNVTAPVDMFGLASALRRFGTVEHDLQRDVLSGLLSPANSQLAALEWESQLIELTDPLGLGSHHWVQVRRDPQ